MQGPPPLSPSYNMAPPIKKQRGTEGGPPVVGQDVAQQRRAQLQNLRSGYANRPNMGPPPARGTIPTIGFNPGAARTAANGTTTQNNNNANLSNGTSNNHRPGVPERGPNLVRDSDLFPSAPKAETPAVARRLDVAFREPHHASSPPPQQGGPPTPSAVPPPGSAPPGASPRAAAPPLVAEPPSSAPPPMASPEQAAAAPPPKQVGFAPTTPAAPKVNFAAPKTPAPNAPPPSPATPAGVSSPEPVVSPPQTPGFAAHAGQTPFHQNNAKKNAGHTPFPGKAVATTPPGESPMSTAGGVQTPYPNKSVQFAGQTPHPKAQEQPTSTNRRQKLAQMRNVADTPPPKNNTVVSFADTTTTDADNVLASPEESAELRMQRQLTEETKRTEQLLRKVAELEDQLAQQATESAAKVSFMSPMASPTKSGINPMDRLTPTRRRAATPYPKRNQGEETEIDPQFFEQATEDVPYKFEAGDDEDDGSNIEAVFVVRRPYGYGDMDHELWFAAGEKNAKLYHRDATVENIASIEVAVQIGADESVLLLYNDADIRHQNAVEGKWNRYGNFYERGEALGTVAYIDVDANEKEYSLDKLAEQAIEVRKHYCASLRNMAIALQRRVHEGHPLSPQGAVSPLAAPGSAGPDMGSMPSSPKVDACVGTDEIKFPPANDGDQPRGGPPVGDVPPAAVATLPPQPPPMTQEPSSDLMSIFVGMLFSFVWGLAKFPFSLVGTLIRWVLVVMLGLCVYLWMLDNMGWTGVAPPLHYYHNPPGIM